MNNIKPPIKTFTFIKFAPTDGHKSIGFEFPLLGEGDQMWRQKIFLQQHGFEIGWADRYPALKTRRDFYEAVKLIYEHQVDGWWLYKDLLIQMGIFYDDAEFIQALNNFIVKERAKLSRLL
ncbi:TPA: hypothetical protein EYP66_24240 [Candidatus Poribacteria bacterium]|nr:hypothetical protein [Candidatus Poribacteria bacterium]